jgi:hypothetical protein
LRPFGGAGGLCWFSQISGVLKMDTVAQLSSAFREKMRSYFPSETLAEIDRRNKFEADSSVCHSHDFCDANMVMLEAFIEVSGRDYDFGSDADMDLWNEAWDKTKADGFSK